MWRSKSSSSVGTVQRDAVAADTKWFRVVGVRNEDADDYHLYVTNLSRGSSFRQT